ncbi:MAG: hypothetical protein CO056_02265 [Candidatus Tagabacteria bacterium CG_4_9_14_0_2_um_filter_41_11]|uniref:Phosphoribosylanthranilate isomerase n=1 Tax=Candidatus Tagabacteria bacterium CG_4_9_14_0_2_um_filter_41_11 TaxID=1975019 RepID=A0A2M8EQQ5_9BACT|nr:MAG: hypothetical protein CO056_02265 [Candidatus Tagabacteria bacterium CG_4_9_14_0_2_um_filter_41_11]
MDLVDKAVEHYSAREIKHIAEIFCKDSRILNLIHYNTKNTDLLSVQLATLTELVGPLQFDGFQLNIAWPPPLELLSYKCLYPDKKFVLQVGSSAFEAIENSPDKLAERLILYIGLIDYVLLDFSGGKGLILDAEKLRPYLRVVVKTTKNVGIGVAGGLGPSTMHLIEPLLDEFPSLCIDAEGKLRDEYDHLSSSYIKKYISNAFKLFKPKASLNKIY